MASKRMFDKAIIETDRFLNISIGAKALYFLLGMEADDEGFVSPSRVMRIYGGEKGDLKNLIDTSLVIPFKSGVVVITDWQQNNWLDNRRIKPTQYQKEKKMLVLTPTKSYELSTCLALAEPEESSIEESRGEYIGGASPPKRVKKVEEEKPFVFNDELELLRNGGVNAKRKDYKIIALYWKKKNWVFDNRKQFIAALRRELRPAGNLAGYTGDQILRSMIHCQKSYAEWSLETCHKRISDLINKK